MRLSKTQRARLAEITRCSSMGTARWRDFVPLSNLGLVEIDEGDAPALSSMFGASYRHLRATDKGREVAKTLDLDSEFPRPTKKKPTVT